MTVGPTNPHAGLFSDRKSFWAENGKYRRKLLDFVVAYYSNNRKALEPTRAFGMSGAQLGVRIEAFARKVSHGWKPGDK